MRQTLLRIRLDEFFTLAPLDGVTSIGVGWFAVVVLGLFAVWCHRHREQLDERFRGNWFDVWIPGAKKNDEVSITALIGCAVCLALFTAPFWSPATAYFKKHGYAFLPVYGYGFMLFVGFLLATWWAGRRARVVGLAPEHVWDGSMCLLVGGIAGARIWYLLQHGRKTFAGKSGWDAVRAIFELQEGGLVLYGGIVLGTIVFVIYCRARKIDTLLLADVLVPSFFIGLGFGRVGCFLNGCCFGDRCSLAWGVEFPKGSVPYEVLLSRGVISPEAAASLPLHPTQLYSAINAFLIAGLLHAYFRYRPQNGAVVALAAATYPITRFVIELLRDDELGQFNTALTISQWFSILLCPLGLLFVGWLATRRSSGTTRPPASGTAA